MWPVVGIFRIAICQICAILCTLLLLMPMPMMDIWHVIVLMFFSGMFMFVRMCTCDGCIMRMSGFIMPVAMFMEQGSMNV